VVSGFVQLTLTPGWSTNRDETSEHDHHLLHHIIAFPQGWTFTQNQRSIKVKEGDNGSFSFLRLEIFRVPSW